MSKMIPPFYNEEKTSFAEVKLFNALRKLPDTYTILHSIGLAEHKSKIFSEIDFVIISKKGILCLEVKGGQVYRENGVWHFVDRFNNITQKTEGPFEQSISAMFSLREYLKKHFGPRSPISQTLFACGVAFPDIPFNQKGPDIISEIIYDIRSHESQLEVLIDNMYSYWNDRLKITNNLEPAHLSDSYITKVVDFLRGDFGYVTTLNYIVKRTSEDLLSLTKEQMIRLEMASENPRILLSGGAGTGKTLLSLEHARRLVIKGKKVLYLCFNRNLCDFLNHSNSDKGEYLIEGLQIKTFHQILERAVKDTELIKEADIEDKQNYFEKELPEAFCDLEGTGVIEKYDAIIIDEGQDLIKYEYLMCIDLMLEKGLKDGIWHICFDPFQNLYNSGFKEGMELIENTNHIKLNLDTNCRNTRPVGIYNTLLTGVPPVKRFKVDGITPEKYPYCDNEDQKHQLIKLVKKLIGQGVNPGSIYILSSRTFEKSCLQGENIFKSICKFQNATNIKPSMLIADSLKFSTVHSFKGLEADIIIYVDVDCFESSKDRMINYTAISRAKSLLYIFYNEKAEDELNKMISSSASNLELIEA